jgi:sialic acid synthase SpsE/mannose-6-phosphate isomerase-like protein (cupin superfamily)
MNPNIDSIDFSSLSPANPLLILDLANNHNGSLDHGKRIIDEIATAVAGTGFQVAIKFQFRDLPNFIHPDFRERRDLKYVDRFLSTQMSWESFTELRNYIRKVGFLAACTPFDEFSVKKIIELEFDVLKIASASFTDWSLLESIVQWDGPIVGSTAGVSFEDIDRVVSFLKNRNKKFAIMHCVAAYPTTDDQLLISRITELKNRYTGVSIGYSTHEAPDNMIAGPLALAAGAVILERHIGSPEDGSTLNQYSSSSTHLIKWLDALKQSIKMLGEMSPEVVNESEVQSLRGLRRYAFAKRSIKAGEIVDSTSIFYAIPGSENQLQANDLGKYIGLRALKDIDETEALSSNNVQIDNQTELLTQIRNQIIDFVTESAILFPENQTLEISHHYGLENYHAFGLGMITLVNLDYCKKFLILLSGQKNPAHYHKHKDETFFVLYGNVTVKIDNNNEFMLKEGQTIRIPPNSVHEFWTANGAIIEELSTKHIASDSFYIDNEINSSQNRKSFITYWKPRT